MWEGDVISKQLIEMGTGCRLRSELRRVYLEALPSVGDEHLVSHRNTYLSSRHLRFERKESDGETGESEHGGKTRERSYRMGSLEMPSSS